MIETAKEALYYALTNDTALKNLLGTTDNRIFGEYSRGLEVIPSITFFVFSSQRENGMSDRFIVEFQLDVWGNIHSVVADQIVSRIYGLLHNTTIKVNGTLKSFLCTVGQAR